MKTLGSSMMLTAVLLIATTLALDPQMPAQLSWSEFSPAMIHGGVYAIGLFIGAVGLSIAFSADRSAFDRRATGHHTSIESAFKQLMSMDIDEHSAGSRRIVEEGSGRRLIVRFGRGLAQNYLGWFIVFLALALGVCIVAINTF
ncbi:MAG: hypothetical protein ABL973_11440 [Micropepsaceae bacterium]